MKKNNRCSRFQLSALVIVGLFNSLEAAALNYTITDIGTGGGLISAQDLNNSGQVVGKTLESTGLHAYLWTNGIMQTLNIPSSGEGINNSGQIVGALYPSGQPYHGFVSTNGVIQDLGAFDSNYTYTAAYGINDIGQVVGHMSPQSGYSRAFVWSNGVMQDIGTLGGPESYAYRINNSGQIIGWSTTGGPNPNGFLYSNRAMTNLGALDSSLNYSVAQGINEAGQVVGGSRIAGGWLHAFAWSNGAMQDLGTLGNGCVNESYAFDNNNLGQVVGSWKRWNCLGGGSYSSGIGDGGGFVYDNGVMYDLNSLVSANSGWLLGEARGINDLGQIVGTGTLNGVGHAYLLTPTSVVPLPAAFWLFGSGLLGMFGFMRRVGRHS